MEQIEFAFSLFVFVMACKGIDKAIAWISTRTWRQPQEEEICETS